MSCNCKKTETAEGVFSCSCDRFEHPPALNIGAGLRDLPRQIAGFPEFRRAMLFDIRRQPALDYWRARDEDDYGVMLLEMWAYICDSLSFYDQVIAHEAYLRTAKRRPSARKLAALIGYLSRPAVGSTVQLTALAEGRLPLELPRGLGFRSGSFDGNPPQVFELDADTLVHPLTNRWSIRAPKLGVIAQDNPSFLLIAAQADLKPGMLLLLKDSDNNQQTQALRIRTTSPHTGVDGRIYTKVEFQAPTRLSAGTRLDRLRLFLPTISASLWTTNGSAVSKNTITLDGIHRHIQTGDDILIEYKKQDARWFEVDSVSDSRQDVGPAVFLTTQLTLDVDLEDATRKSLPEAWTDKERSSLRVHCGMIPAGIIADEPKPTLGPNDPLVLEQRAEAPLDGYRPKRFSLTDKNLRGLPVEGQINFEENRLLLSQGQNWQPDLTLPVELWGNVLDASRGETVRNEILGSGNAALPGQTFKLKKKPLTYLLAPSAENEQGVKNTLRVYVNRILWREAPSFYGKKPSDEVYIVRQNDEGDFFVIFGDGVRGSRLPSGADNVIAFYRFGAGRAAPPAGSVNQLVTPVPGLRSVKNPAPASGGADAESRDDIRKNAPKSALLLGRAVSIQDMEAATRAVPGVRNVQTEWRWHGIRQCAVAHIWYIGEGGIESKISLRLRTICDPSTPIQVEQAKALPVALALQVEIDPRFIETDVTAGLREVFFSTETGFLIPENTGVGAPLFRSKIFETALSVEGVLSVQGILWNGSVFADYGKSPGAGRYFDFNPNALFINGSSK